MSWLILGLALVIGVGLSLKWLTTAEPRAIIKAIKWLAIIVIVAVVAVLALTGKFAFAFAALPALFVWFMRLRTFSQLLKNFRRATGGGAPKGQTSQVETNFFKMVLDHDTGKMSGHVVRGSYAGFELEVLSLEELLTLREECKDDPQSLQVLDAFLEREYDDQWREQSDTKDTSYTQGTGMSENEALDILGLEYGASDETIKEAYHRLISKIHPDLGGSTYLAAKINQAKDVLLSK
ncbi:MAG: DnaJ domain-containing protein [Alphaproteobacteria bacterium]|nr:DnaJ domain-containing protein [Rhodospirillales bacterium]MCW9045503.1 DnaJ domain-containing protein [Alphaproteobacteria bacterium]